MSESNDKPADVERSGGTACYEIAELPDGGFEIRQNGRVRGKYADAKTMAAHFVFALQENEKARDIFRWMKAYGVRLPEAMATDVDRFLNPCTEKVDCTS